MSLQWVLFLYETQPLQYVTHNLVSCHISQIRRMRLYFIQTTLMN